MYLSKIAENLSFSPQRIIFTKKGSGKMDFPLKKIERDIEIEGLNSIYYFEFSKDFTHPPEKHDFWVR